VAGRRDETSSCLVPSVPHREPKIRYFRIVDVLSELGRYISMAAIVAIMVLVTSDVLMRNTLGTSVAGTLEVAEFLQGAAVFLGLAATLRSGSHIAADLLVDRLSKRTQAVVDLCTNILSLAIFALMTYALVVAATGPGASDEISDMLGIPIQPFKLLAAFGVGLMCLEIVRLIARFVAVLAGGRK